MIGLLLSTALAEEPRAPDAPPAPPLAVDRRWTALALPEDTREAAPLNPHARFALAAERLGVWVVDLAGVPIDGAALAPFGVDDGEPLTRRVREALGRPIDVEDLLYFLDDVLAADDRRGERFHVHTGRARDAGILVHPDDVFRAKPRSYPPKDSLAVDVPAAQPEPDEAAADHDLPGPAWTARYKNPSEREAMLEGLAAERPDADFAARVRSLIEQLETSGAEVYLASASRSRHRGYLMWGSFLLSRAKNSTELEARADLLDRRNREWGLDIPITWRHPDGWQATREAARAMADSYDVVYATEKGARESNHYGGTAVDLIAIALPRRVTLTAPDGATRSFDLTDPDEPRDLSLTPRMITWIEEHFRFSKLLADHPHWDDNREQP